MLSNLFYLALAVAPAFSTPLPQAKPGPNKPKGIIWNNCEETPWMQGVQCANMTVPINWDDPKSKTFSLGLVKLARTENTTTKRLGYLFVNPGGPGESATTFVANIGFGVDVAPEILDSFDIIGLDPRGVHMSVSSDCDADIWNERVSLFPKTKAEYEKLVDKNKRLGKSCQKKMGELANHLDTISAAKDMEAVRKAFGEKEKMNWVGLSYGSQLGAQYAQLFPDNIRAMVLDGVVQHSGDDAKNVLVESTAYAAALQSFFTWAETNDESPLKDQDVEKLWYDILKKAAEAPIQVPDCQETYNEGEGEWESHRRCDVNDEEIRFNAQGLLIDTNTEARKRFANALRQASKGDATAFETQLPHSLFDRRLFPGKTIGCQDWAPKSSSWEEFQAKMRMAEVFAPLNKGASQTWSLQASCIGWPAPLNNPPKKLNVPKTKNPILMVNSLRDPSTSYAWAVGMMQEIQNAVLLTRNGDGHTSFIDEGKTRDAINRYILTLETPAPGTVYDS